MQLFLTAAGLLCLAWVAQALFLAPTKTIPGPWYARLTNLVLKWHVITGNRCHYIHALHQKYGSVVLIAPREVAVASFEGCQKVHRVNSGFLKTDWYESLNDMPRNGVFAMRDPHQHAARRRLFAQAFSKTALRKTWEPIVVQKVNSAVQKMLHEAQMGTSDMLKWWTFMATDVSGHLMFGDSFGMLELGTKNEYIEVLERTMMGGGIGTELPIVRWIGKRWPSAAARTMFRGNGVLLAYAEKAVTNARNSKGNIFSNALAEAEKAGGKMDNLDVKVEAGNLIVAGSDTTAITLTYLIWTILQNSTLRLRLEEEILLLSDGFTDAHLEDLKLCNATIDEALRLYGAAPGSLPRVAHVSGVEIDCHFIPAGYIVSTQAWSLHRNPEIFEEPLRFNPDRWLSESPKLEVAKAAMSAFGKGSRTCLGIHLARMELRYGLVLFLQHCKSLTLAASVTKESMEVKNFFLIAPKAHRC